MGQVIYNSHYNNGAPAMFTLLVLAKATIGKHCREPHCRNGVVDHLGQSHFSHRC